MNGNYNKMAEQTLKEKTAKGLFWGALNNGTMQILNVLIGILLARLLSNADYGLMGMLAVFTAVAGALQESGFTSANTGCATCDVVPDTIVLAIVSHLNACEKFPTAFAV